MALLPVTKTEIEFPTVDIIYVQTQPYNLQKRWEWSL